MGHPKRLVSQHVFCTTAFRMNILKKSKDDVPYLLFLLIQVNTELLAYYIGHCCSIWSPDFFFPLWRNSQPLALAASFLKCLDRTQLDTHTR